VPDGDKWLALTHCPFSFLGKEGPLSVPQKAGLQSQSRHGGEENLNLIMNV